MCNDEETRQRGRKEERADEERRLCFMETEEEKEGTKRTNIAQTALRRRCSVRGIIGEYILEDEY